MLLASPGALAQTISPTTISAQLLGDYYYVVSHHRPELEDRSGLWYRRIYLTFDHTFEKNLTARLRFEMSHPGDFRSSAPLDPFVKDAYLDWKYSARGELMAGIIPTPTWEAVERLWGYRSLEKAPGDLYRLGSARDFGVALLGSLDAAKMLRYHLVLGNGSNLSAETNEGKLAALALAYAPSESWFVELYADRNHLPDSKRTTAQAFVYLQRSHGRLGLQYIAQRRESSGGGGRDLAYGSIFGVVRLREKISVVGRYDHGLDPNPEGDVIPYLPIAPDAESRLMLLGVDLTVHPNVSVIPNVEVVRYEDGPADEDIIARITLYFRF